MTLANTSEAYEMGEGEIYQDADCLLVWVDGEWCELGENYQAIPVTLH